MQKHPRGVKKVGFLGTKYTMEHAYLQDRLRAHGLEVFAPTDPQEWETIQKVIMEELSHNVIKQESKRVFLEAIERLRERGAEGVVLGCTEIPLLIKQGDVENDPDFPLFDSTGAHVAAAVEVQLGRARVEDYRP